MSLGGCLPLPWGYIHVFDHNIQTSFSLKPLDQSKPNFMWSILRKGQSHTCQLFEISKSDIACDDPKVTSFCAYFSRVMILPQLLGVRFFS